MNTIKSRNANSNFRHILYYFRKYNKYGVRKLFGSFGAIQQKWTIEDVIAEGDKVVVRATNTCLQESFFGIPSYGREQTFTAIFIHWIVDGKIIETWRNADDLGRVLQLGARIEPGTSG